MLENCKINHKQILNKIENAGHFNWMSTGGPDMNINETVRISLNNIYPVNLKTQSNHRSTPLKQAIDECLSS